MDFRKGGAKTHYPSWGSGTATFLRSLPVPATHYPSWGSGTNTAQAHEHLRCKLTTPHGDQEPRQNRAARQEHVNSLPLMGIRNRSGRYS